jgi:DNA repair protein RecO (recombination protein O)
MLKSSAGLLLHHFPYSDNSRIIRVLTPNDGLISAFLRVSRKNVRQGVLQPLSLLEMVFDKHPDKDLATIREIRISDAYSNIGRDVYRGAVVLFLNEVLNQVIREGTEDPALFAFIREWLIHYDATEFDADAHLYFLAHVSAISGYLPDGEFSDHTPYFDLEAGRYVPRFPGHPRFLEGENARIFGQFFSAEQHSSLSYHQRRQLLSALMDYFRIHFPDFREIRSLAVLEELFRP